MTQTEHENISEQILDYLRTETKLPIDNILKKYNISIDELHKSIFTIESWGYTVKKDDDTLSFLSAPDTLIDSEISFKLQTILIGKKIIAFQAVQSTNDSATKLAEQNALEGTIVVAEKQTKGKGRFGRVWQSIEQKGIYCSIILRPTFSPEYAPGLSLMTAVALADTFKQFTDAKVQIKWPNDVLLNGKKTAGILTELSADKNKINHVIVGIGININHSNDDFNSEILDTATSLAIENGTKIKRVELLQKLLVNFENEYENYKINYLKSIQTKLRSYSSLLGTDIQLALGNEIISGKVIDINEQGALVIESDGKRIEVNSGEVTVVKT